jgi:hypothetical protein
LRPCRHRTAESTGTARRRSLHPRKNEGTPQDLSYKILLNRVSQRTIRANLWI